MPCILPGQVENVRKFTQSIFFNPTTQDEITEIAKTFLPGKAAGYDQIP